LLGEDLGIVYCFPPKDNDITIQLGELDEAELQSLAEIKSPSSECRIRILYSDSVFRKKNDRIAKGSVIVLTLK
jgi:hypothetical protein